MSEDFDVKVGVHQGAILSPLLFVSVFDVVSKNVKKGLPWKMLYTDDMVLVAESVDDLIKRLCE